MKFARYVFLIAGIYGLIVLAPLYFLEARIGQDTPPAITHPEYFYGFVGVGLAWQLLFLIIARDPLRYRLAMLPSIVEKVTFGIACLALYLQQRLTLQMLMISGIDMGWAILFAISFVKTREQ
jgi:hypothetical protein